MGDGTRGTAGCPATGGPDDRHPLERTGLLPPRSSPAPPWCGPGAAGHTRTMSTGARRPSIDPRAVVALLGLVVVGAGVVVVLNALDSGGPRVVVVGDSVTTLSSEELAERFDWAGTLDIRAVEGRTTEELLPLAREGVEEGPDIGIFLPGYNDILQDAAEAGLPALAEMVDLADRIPCVVWFLVPEEGAYSAEQARIWNDEIRRLVGEREGMAVDDAWWELVTESPDMMFLSEGDAVHPDAQGQAALATVMEAAAERECR